MSVNLNNIYSNLNNVHNSFGSMVSSLMEAITTIEAAANQNNITTTPVVQPVVQPVVPSMAYYETVWYKYFQNYENQYTNVGKAIYVPVNDFPSVENPKYLNELIDELNVERVKLGLTPVVFSEVGGWYVPRENFRGYQFKAKILEYFPHLQFVKYLDDFNVKPQPAGTPL
jgi:hypothetical protein